MSFNTNDKQVGELLNKTAFSIPRNQRRYVWPKDNWDELFEDVLFSCNAHGELYFGVA